MSEVEPSGYTPEGVVDTTPDTADREASDGTPVVARKAAASSPSPAGHAVPLMVMVDGATIEVKSSSSDDRSQTDSPKEVVIRRTTARSRNRLPVLRRKKPKAKPKRNPSPPTAPVELDLQESRSEGSKASYTAPVQPVPMPPHPTAVPEPLGPPAGTPDPRREVRPNYQNVPGCSSAAGADPCGFGHAFAAGNAFATPAPEHMRNWGQRSDGKWVRGMPNPKARAEAFMGAPYPTRSHQQDRSDQGDSDMCDDTERAIEESAKEYFEMHVQNLNRYQENVHAHYQSKIDELNRLLGVQMTENQQEAQKTIDEIRRTARMGLDAATARSQQMNDQEIAYQRHGMMQQYHEELSKERSRMEAAVKLEQDASQQLLTLVAAMREREGQYRSHITSVEQQHHTQAINLKYQFDAEKQHCQDAAQAEVHRASNMEAAAQEKVRLLEQSMREVLSQQKLALEEKKLMEARLRDLQDQKDATQGCPNCYPVKKPASERDPRYTCPSCAQDFTTQDGKPHGKPETYAMDKDSPAKQHVQFASGNDQEAESRVPPPPKAERTGVSISSRGRARATKEDEWDGWICENRKKDIWILVDPKTKHIIGRYRKDDPDDDPDYDPDYDGDGEEGYEEDAEEESDFEPDPVIDTDATGTDTDHTGRTTPTASSFDDYDLVREEREAKWEKERSNKGLPTAKSTGRGKHSKHSSKATGESSDYPPPLEQSESDKPKGTSRKRATSRARSPSRARGTSVPRAGKSPQGAVPKASAKAKRGKSQPKQVKTQATPGHDVNKRGRSRERNTRRPSKNPDKAESSSDSSDAERRCRKEFNKIEIRALPSFAQLEGWRHMLRDSMIATANRTDETRLLAWWGECNTKSVKELATCPKEFVRLDRKLADGLNKVLTGQLYRQVLNKKRSLDIHGLPPLRGRQVYRMTLDEYKTDKYMERYLSTLDMEKVQWRGDSISEMRAFRQDWEHLETNLSPDIPESEKLEVLLDRMSHSKVLEMKVDDYRELPHKSRRRTLQKLLDLIDRYLSKDKMRENRIKKRNAMPGIGNKSWKGQGFGAAARGGTPVCGLYLNGKCAKTSNDCAMLHPDGMDGAYHVIRGKGKPSEDREGGGGWTKGKNTKGGKQYEGKGKTGKGKRGKSGGRGKGGYANAATDGGYANAASDGGNASGAGSSRAPSPANTQQSEKPCHNWALKGTCEYGESCRYSHKFKPGQGLPWWAPEAQKQAMKDKGNGKGKTGDRDRSTFRSGAGGGKGGGKGKEKPSGPACPAQSETVPSPKAKAKAEAKAAEKAKAEGKAKARPKAKK